MQDVAYRLTERFPDPVQDPAQVPVVPEVPVVLSLCDYTGNMVRPWAAAGYDCWIVDIQHAPGEHRGADGIMRVGANILYWTPPFALPRVAAAFAFSPCTDIAVSGARWFAEKGLRALARAIDLFGACVEICEATGAPWMAENPVSVIASHYRKPDFTFNPCDYAGWLADPAERAAEAYTKRTCLWTGGGFSMPEARPVAPVLGSKMHLLPPSPERANLRSATPRGFAQAVFMDPALRRQAVAA